MVAFYQVDLVFGAPIKQFGDDEGTYASDRLIRFAHGDSKRALTRHSGNLTASNESYTECIESREITVKNDTATTTVTIRDGCNVPLSLVSYRKPGPGWSPETEPDQTFVDADSATLGPGTHTFSVALPDAYGTTSDRTAVAGDSATFGENVTLGPGVVVGDNATVASETSVSHRTLLGRNVTVGSGVTIGAGVIVSHDVSIGDGTQIGSGTRVGSGVSIGQNVLIGQNVKIRPGVSIDDGATIPPNTTVDSDVSGTDEGVTPSEPTAPPSTSPAMPAVPGNGSQSPTAPQTESPAEPEPTATATAEPAPTATDTATASPDTSTTTQPSESTTQPPSSTRTETSAPTESPPSTSTETVPTTASTTTPSDTTTESQTTNTATATSSPTAEQPTKTGTTTGTVTQSPGTPTTAPNPTSTAPTTTPTPTASPTATATATPPTDTTTTSTPPATTNPSPTTSTETSTSTTTATTTETTTQTTTTTPTTTSTTTATQTTTTTEPTETTTPEPPGSPNIALSPAASDYGETLVGTNGTQTFTITNDGDANLSVDGVTLTGSNTDQFEITDGGGSFVLAPGDSRVVTVTFSPTATGQQTATLEVTSDDSDSPTVSSTLAGTGVQPAIELTPTEYDYGSVPVDSGNTQTFTVTNNGTAPLSVTATQITGADADQFEVTAGGGQFTLAPGESRDLRVRFGPTSAGAKNATLDVISEAADGGVLSATLSGTGTQSNIVVEPPSLAYGDVSNGNTSTQTFSIANDGDAPLNASGTSIEGVDAGEFAITNGSGPFTLAPGESREVTVQFAPTATGDKTAEVVIESDDADQPTVTVPLSGGSVEPNAVLTPETYDYGDVAVGSGDTQTFTVTNDGTAPLSVNATRLIGADSDQYTFVSGDGAFTLAPGESREVTVAFAPTSTGTKNATLAVASDDPDSPTLTSSLSGTGTQSNIVVDPTSLDYGEVPNNGESTRTFLVTNDGTAPLSVNGTTLSGANAGEFTITDGGGAFTLAPGESREVTVQFAPSSVGERNAQLVVESDDADQTTVTVSLTGESVAPNVVLSPPSYDFGEVPTGSANTTTFTVTNDGTAPLSVNGTTMSGTNAGEFAIIDGGGAFTLAPGESREVTVEFAPNTTGAKSATLEVESNDPDQPTVSSNLSGTGVESNIVVDPENNDYGQVANNGNSTQTFTVTNDGTAPLSVSGTSIAGNNASEFTITDGGGTFTLAPGESREVTVRFAPTTTGAKDAQLVVESDDPNQPTVTVPLAGQSVKPTINLTPQTYDYGGVAVNTGNVTTFTVTNDGDAPLTVSGTGIVGPNASDFTIVDGGGPFTLQPGESQGVEVRIDFAPTTTGEKKATFVVESDDPDQPTVTVPLSGTSIAPSISLTPETRDFGEVPAGSANTTTFTVTNDGTAGLNVSAVNIVGTNASEFTVIGPDGPFSVEPGQSRTITVEFAPDSAGAKNATIEVQSNDPNQPTVTADLTGTGTASNLVADPVRYDFGEVATGTTNTTTITVTNDGSAPLAVTDTSIVGANGEEFTIVDGGGPFTLVPGEVRQITVSFSPTSAGPKDASLMIESDAVNQQAVTVPLSGSGFVPQCNVQVSDVTAPSTVTQGEQATVTANVTNTGQANGCTENATITASGQSAGKVDIVFLLDDSGSMQPFIDQVANDIRGFNNELDGQGIDARFAVVTYGKGSAVLRQDYSSDVAQTERTIDGISASGAFEANYRAIRGSLNALSPRSDAKTVLIDITNEDSDRLSTDPTQNELVTLIDDKNAKLISVSPDVDYIRNYNNQRGEAYDPALDLRVLAERVADGAWFDLLSGGSLVDKFSGEVITSVGQNVTDEQSITLDAGESQQVTLNIDTSQFTAGEITYSVTVNASTRTGRITVE